MPLRWDTSVLLLDLNRVVGMKQVVATRPELVDTEDMREAADMKEAVAMNLALVATRPELVDMEDMKEAADMRRPLVDMGALKQVVGANRHMANPPPAMRNKDPSSSSSALFQMSVEGMSSSPPCECHEYYKYNGQSDSNKLLMPLRHWVERFLLSRTA